MSAILPSFRNRFCRSAGWTSRARWFARLAGVALCGLVVLSGRTSVPLIEDGRSVARIVIPVDAIPAERYAADELRRHLEAMTGVAPAIITDAEPAEPAEIWVGRSRRLAELGDAVDWVQLGSDGFLLRTEGERLVVVGGRPRGTLNGVHTLLEEELGVRWFTPEVEQVPQVDSVRVGPLDRTVVPVFEYREVFWTEMMRDADFAARHRLNGNHYRLGDRHGGPAVVYHPFVHSFDLLVPRELYDSHPDYFPLIDGQRRGGYVQRCLSHPDVLRLSIQRVRQWLRERPDVTIVSVSQNDTFQYCQCAECKELDEAEGSPSATLLRFVNAIAADIEEVHPGVRIDTLAYQYTRQPPRTIRPHRNVIIRLCSIECCFAHPLDSCSGPHNRRFVEDIQAWQPVAPRLYVWDYTPNFAHYQQPFPNFDVLQPNVRFFARHGVRGLFEQGSYSPGGNGELGPLRAYVLAKLLWDPETDVERHIDEFTRAYYGNVAPLFRAWLEAMHEPVRGHDRHAHIFDPPTASYLTDAVIEAGERLLGEAERMAESEAIRFRIQMARLPVWYVQLATNRVTGEERCELIRRFLEVARRGGITHISEHRPFEDWARALEAETRQSP
jgi:hypothetical protein